MIQQKLNGGKKMHEEKQEQVEHGQDQQANIVVASWCMPNG